MKPNPEVQRRQKIESILYQVLDVAPDAQQALAVKLARGDEDLLDEVLSLLRSSSQAASSQAASSQASDTGSKLGLATEVDGNPEVAAALSLANRATLDSVRAYFGQHRPELQIVNQVGEGAAGIVVKAIDKKLDRFVAIKILHRNWVMRLGSDALSREAVAGSLSSDHIVRVYEISSSSSSLPFIIMEWIEGPSLREHLLQRSALPSREAAKLAFQIATGLAAAQRRNVVHGDIKPANVMLEHVSSEASHVPQAGDAHELSSRQSMKLQTTAELYRAKLTDFGLARRVSAAEPATVEGSSSENFSGFAGTPAYASPEMLLHSRPASQSSDIWAVGATLYHMLCGVPPYNGRPHAIARQMRLGAPSAPRQIDPRIHRDLESICLRALNSSESQRYSSAEDLADDLNRFLDGLPVKARPVRWPGKLLRLVQRRPLASSLVAGLFLTLSVGSIISNHFRMRAEDHLEVAVENSRIATQERDNALTVVKLLKSMISASDSHFGNPDIKMVDALAGLESRLDSSLDGKSGIESEIRSSLGAMYFSIAAYEASERQYQKAIALRGPDCLEEVQIHDRIELANTLRWLYRFTEALESAAEATRQAERMLGAHHNTTLYGKEVLAGCYKDLGKPDEAAELLRSIIEHSSEPQTTLTAKSGLASVLIDQGMNSEAETHIRDSIALRQKIGLNDSRESIVLESNLGVALLEQGKLEEAIKVQQICAQRANQLLGPTHDLTLSVWLNVADTTRRRGELDQAMKINLQLWNTCREKLGPAHPKTLDCAESVILNHVRLKQYAEALRLAEEVTAEAASKLGADDDWHQKLASLRCSALTGLGRAKEAVPIQRQVVEHFDKKFGSEAVSTIVYKNNFGLTLIEAGELEQAVDMYRQLIADAKVTERLSVARSLKRNLGLALLRAGQIQEARELLDATYRESQAAGEIENANKCLEYLDLLPAPK